MELRLSAGTHPVQSVAVRIAIRFEVLRRLWADLGEEHLSTKRAKEMLAGHARGNRVSGQVYQTKEDEEAIREASRGHVAIREVPASGQI